MSLRTVPTPVHGVVDRVTAAALVLAPNLFRLDGPSAAVPRANGILAAVYSNLTDYEASPKNVISMRTHLGLDAGSGVFLAASPFALGYWRKGLNHWLPHVAVGAFELTMSLITETQPPRTTPGRLARLRRLLPT
jgi:hypothetical protein